MIPQDQVEKLIALLDSPDRKENEIVQTMLSHLAQSEPPFTRGMVGGGLSYHVTVIVPHERGFRIVETICLHSAPETMIGCPVLFIKRWKSMEDGCMLTHPCAKQGIWEQMSLARMIPYSFSFIFLDLLFKGEIK